MSLQYCPSVHTFMLCMLCMHTMQHFLQLNRRDSAAQKPALHVQKPGDEMGYSYDLGDHWMHDIRLISLLPAEESNERCLVRLLG